MIARVDDCAPAPIRPDLEVPRRAARVERNRPWVHNPALEQEPVACDEPLLGHPWERAPCGLLGRAVCGVVTRGADVIGLRAWHGAYGARNESAHESAKNDHRERASPP